MTAIPVTRVNLDAQTNAPVSATVLLAMTRARVDPFTSTDWSGFAGATAPAFMVQLHPADLAALLAELALDHWPPDYVTVVLDANGLSLMLHSPVNSYAWHVDLAVRVQSGGDPGTAEEYWTCDGRDGSVAEQIATLPPQVRKLIMACPTEAQPYVLKGYLQAEVAALGHTHWLYEEATDRWVLRRRNGGDGSAGPVELRSRTPDELRAYGHNNGHRVLESRPPLSAFVT